MRLRRSTTGVLVAFAALASIVGCGGGDADDNEATPAVVRTATARAEAIVVTESDLGDGWDALPDDELTPSEVQGAPAILDRSFKSWAACVGNLLSGGFIGLGRAAVESSPRFGDDSGRIVAGASAVFTVTERQEQVIAALAASNEACDVGGETLSTAIEELEDPAGSVTSYRLTATLAARSETFTETFDLMVFRGDLAISLLVFKGFGANGAGQADIAETVDAKLR